MVLTILAILAIIVIMNTTKISASDLKNNTADILNMVAFGGYEAIVERYGEDLVKIVPIAALEKKKDFKILLGKYFGINKGFPEVHKDRLSSAKNTTW